MAVVAAAAQVLCAIRIGPNQHVTGLLLDGGAIVTVDQVLPVTESYTVVLSDRSLMSARPGLRNPKSNLAVVRLDTSVACLPLMGTIAAPGAVAIVLGADGEAEPTVRLTIVHRLQRTAKGVVPVLDLPRGSSCQGELVLDASGRLIGLAAFGPDGESIVIASALIQQVILPTVESPLPEKLLIPARFNIPSRKGWLGVTLQPINLPDQLAARAGQSSGRMVVSVTPGGPADKAGLRIDDVLLTVNDSTVTGPNALRNFLSPERIGSVVEAKLLRDGNLVMAHLTVGTQPG